MLLLVLIVTLGVLTATAQDECRGMLPLPTEKCNEYLLFHQGKPYIYQCPDGLLFDKNKLICDLPENTDCEETNECIKNGVECPNVDSDHPVYTPLPNCTEFCECSKGVPYLHNCPDGLHWNPILNACDFPERAGCTTRTTTSNPITTSDVHETTTGTTTFAPNTTSGVPKTTTRITTSAPNTTSDVPETTTRITTFAPNTTSGVPKTTARITTSGPNTTSDVPETTTRITTFAPNTTSEVPKTTTRITTSAPNTTSDVPETTTRIITSAPNTTSDVLKTTTRTTTFAPNTTSQAPGTTTSKSDEDVGTDTCLKEAVVCHGNEPAYQAISDCSKFCQCANGRPFLKVCKSGLHFNPKLNVCDWPENAGCENRTTTEKSTTYHPTTTDSWRNDCHKEHIVCPKDEGSKPEFHPLSKCEDYCLCYKGEAIQKQCPFGFHFNPVVHVCESPETAGCQNRTTIPTQHTTTEPASSTWDPTTESPEDGSKICRSQGIICPKNEGTRVEFYALSNCKDFCLCYKGKAVQQHCPLGLHFNPVLHVCESPETAGCQNRTTTPPQHTTTEPDTTTEPASSTWDPTTESPEDGSTICRSQGVKCPRGDPNTSVYRAVSHCRQFCECSNGTPFLFDCPAGTLFNEKLDVCDWPYNVHCNV